MPVSRSASGLNLQSIDLNLLVVFDTVMQERNVTQAGARIGLSQPAMSHALTRLRHMLNDDLFIRSPKGMIPTSRAEQLAVPVRQALNGLQMRCSRSSSLRLKRRERFVWPWTIMQPSS